MKLEQVHFVFFVKLHVQDWIYIFGEKFVKIVNAAKMIMMLMMMIFRNLICYLELQENIRKNPYVNIGIIKVIYIYIIYSAYNIICFCYISFSVTYK